MQYGIYNYINIPVCSIDIHLPEDEDHHTKEANNDSNNREQVWDFSSSHESSSEESTHDDGEVSSLHYQYSTLTLTIISASETSVNMQSLVTRVTLQS